LLKLFARCCAASVNAVRKICDLNTFHGLLAAWAHERRSLCTPCQEGWLASRCTEPSRGRGFACVFTKGWLGLLRWWRSPERQARGSAKAKQRVKRTVLSADARDLV